MYSAAKLPGPRLLLTAERLDSNRTADAYSVTRPPPAICGDSSMPTGCSPSPPGRHHGGVLYSKRKHTIEPVFNQIKSNRRIDRFQGRGRGAVRSEWRLIAASHNLLKPHSHWIAPATG